MTFPIDILRKNSISEILKEIYSHNKTILKKIRDNYLYITKALREFQNMMNQLNRTRNRIANVSRELREYQTVAPEQLEKYFKKMEYTLSQFKCLLLFYLIIENIGAPAKTLKNIMQDLCLLKNTGTGAAVVRHAVIDFMYFPPSKAIKYFLSKSINKSFILESILKCLEDSITNLLIELGIEDSIHTLTMGNRKAYDLILLLEGYTLREIDALSICLAVRMSGTKKVEKIQNFIHHTTLEANQLIEYMSDSVLRERKNYFIKAFNLNEDLEGEKLRQEIINAMRTCGIISLKEFYVEPQYGRFLHIAEDGDICDSDWEVKIDDFLYENDIDHEKPRSGSYGQYYSNSCMYPDWIIDNRMVELFGAEYIPGYLEKIEIKKVSNIKPLISISKDEYLLKKWKTIIKNEFLL